eukprot:13901773-Alexandrium_andersonii.AAC.1
MVQRRAVGGLFLAANFHPNFRGSEGVTRSRLMSCRLLWSSGRTTAEAARKFTSPACPRGGWQGKSAHRHTEE